MLSMSAGVAPMRIILMDALPVMQGQSESLPPDAPTTLTLTLAVTRLVAAHAASVPATHQHLDTDSPICYTVHNRYH